VTTTAYRFGSPPASDFDVMPTDDEVASFRENGFLVVERITTDEEIDWMRPIFEAAFEQVDAGEIDSPNPKIAYQTMFPELRFPELLHTTYLRNAKAYARALLGEDDLHSWGHMIRKPVGNSRLAPWHQDEAYWESELEYTALGSWLPLHDVTVEMGAMQFIPGSHKAGVLNHWFYDGDPMHNLLVADGVDTTQAVACPLKKGGCTFHHQRTLHFTEPNTTDQARYAYPIEHQTVPRYKEQPAQRAWVDAMRAATGHGMIDRYFADGRIIEVPRTD
jgi:hypothetical protein